MNRGIGLSGLAALALSAIGCTRAISLDYVPPPDVMPSQVQHATTVGHFEDNREDPSNWLGAIRDGTGIPIKNLETSGPVNVAVARVFSAALRARGMFAEDSSGRFVLSGTITKLDCGQYARREANVDLQVIITERASGRQVFSKRFKAENVDGSLITLKKGFFGSIEELRLLTQKTLQQVIDSALDDPELQQALR